MNVGFVSLGCSKNLVDTEMMIGVFEKENFKIVSDPKDADIIVVNTCGFIGKAKEEAINTLLEMAEYKKNKCKYLVATGCLVERYKEELKKEMPEVDLFIKFSEYSTFWQQIVEGLHLDLSKDATENKSNKIYATKKDDDKDDGTKFDNTTIDNVTIDNIRNDYIKSDGMKNVCANKQIVANQKNNLNLDKDYNKLDFNNREISTGNNYAYLRIADGCDNFCTFCAIPYIRGRFKSRTEEDIIKEAEILANKGIREIIVIAQDTTKYGVDIYGKPMLADLLHKLSKIDGIEWIRFLYSYPETITDELIEEVKTNDKICNYFDIPIQHISDNILKKMNRKTTKNSIINLIEKLRKEIPNVIIRSTLMVGFPGETDEDFKELCDFVKWAKFDKLGCFAYSKEEGTAAAKMQEQVKANIKKSRYNEIMSIQQKVSNENLKNKIGKVYKALIEDAFVAEDKVEDNVKDNKNNNNKNNENDDKNNEKNSRNNANDQVVFVGRTYMDVPEIDGNVYVTADEKDLNKVEINNFVNCKITGVKGYDLIAKVEEG